MRGKLDIVKMFHFHGDESSIRPHPYEYPDSYINFLLVIYHIFEIPYRQLEGFIRALARYCDLKPIDHSTIHERSMKLNLNMDIGDTDDITIFVDVVGNLRFLYAKTL